MDHIANFIHFFSIGLGIMSIYLALHLKKRTGYKFLRPYIRFLVVLNLVIFLVHFMEAILRSIVGDASYETYLWLNYRHMILVLALCRLYMSLLFLRFCFQLLQKSLPRGIVYGLGGVLLTVILSLYIMQLDEQASDLAESLSILLVHVTLGSAMIYGAAQVLRQRDRVEWILTEMIRPSFVFFILYAALGIVLRIFNIWADRIPENIVLPWVALMALAFNGLNALYMQKVLRMPAPVVQFSDSRLLSGFGITDREQEIIRLICEGKTNKEIAGILFISPVTVRDHTSNIFRKTGVRSRTQLVGLFIERPAG